MSLTVTEITLGGQTVSLRLTTKSIGAFVLKHGVKDAPPIASVLGAMDNLDAKCALLTGALSFPGNANTIRSGEDLLDYLADAGYTPDDVNGLILDLAHHAGLCSLEDRHRLKDASSANTTSTMDKLVALLNGTLNVPDAGADEAPAAPEAENSPT